MLNRVAVLGAGFIGENLIKTCIDRGINLSVLDRGSCPSEIAESVKWVQGSLSSYEDVSKAVRHSQVVFHLISSTVPGDDVDESKELFGIVTQTLQLLRICINENVNRIVFISSSSVYGPNKNLPIAESALPNPISAHGIQKVTLEYYLRLFKHEHGLDCKIMRLANPYGKGQDLHGRQGFISILAGNLKEDRVTNIRGDGEIIRDFIYISDVVEACLLMALTDSNVTVFNIGSGYGASLNYVIGQAESILGRAIPVKYGEVRKVDIPSSILDISRANKYLKFNPNVSLYEGLSKFFSFIKLL